MKTNGAKLFGEIMGNKDSPKAVKSYAVGSIITSTKISCKKSIKKDKKCNKKTPMAVYNSNSTAQMQNRRSIKSRIEEEEYEEDKNQSDSDFDFSEVFKSVNKPHPSKKPTEKQGIPKDSDEYLLQSQDFETQSEQNRKNKLSLDSETRAELGLDVSPQEVKSGHSPTEAKEKDKSGFVSFDKLVGNSTNLSTNSQNEEAEHTKEVRNTEEEKHYEAPQSEEKKFEEDNLEKWPWDEQVTICNQQIFKNKDFRPKQREIINATKNKEDVIALIPTGGGKSLTFQVSAMTEDGCSIVIMPLLSLIEDQVSQMEELGVPCMFNRTIKDIDKVLRNSKYYKLIFMTPERLVQNKAAQDMVYSLYKDNLLERFVLDEVHCVSHWGQDFRKDYLELSCLRRNYPGVPILGLTATATDDVVGHIAKTLGLRNGFKCFKSSFNRPNLIYRILPKGTNDQMIDKIASYIKTRNRTGKCDDSGIIYCLTQKKTESLEEKLTKKGIKCKHFHAGMTPAQRSEIQRSWMKNEFRVIIATIAFGMGINKKDVRFVIHTSMPKSIEAYMQECGRAGRDGEIADCVLYYNYNDRKLLDYFIATSGSNSPQAASAIQANIHNFYKMLDYCEEKVKCRRWHQLKLLGEDFNSNKCINQCDNCEKNQTGADKDVTMQVKNTIIPFIQKTGERSLTIIQLISHLRGKKVAGRKLDDSFKGALRQFSENEIKKIILQLLIRKILKEYFHQNAHSVISYLRFGECFDDIHNHGFKIFIVVSGGKRKGNISKIASNTNSNFANEPVMMDKPEENCYSLGFQDEPNKPEEDKNNRDLDFDPENYNFYKNGGANNLNDSGEAPSHNEALTRQDLSNNDDESLLNEFCDEELLAELSEIKEMSQTQQECDEIAEEIHNKPEEVLYFDPMSRIKLEHCILAIRKPVLEMIYQSEGEARLEEARNVFTFDMFGKIVELLFEEEYSAEEIVLFLDLPECYNSYDMIKEEERLSKPLSDLQGEKDVSIEDELNKLSKSGNASTNASSNFSFNHSANEEGKQVLLNKPVKKIKMAGFKPPIRGATSPIKFSNKSELSIRKRIIDDNASPNLKAYNYIDHDNNRAVEELGKYKVDFVKAGNSRGWGSKKNWKGKRKARGFK